MATPCSRGALVMSSASRIGAAIYIRPKADRIKIDAAVVLAIAIGRAMVEDGFAGTYLGDKSRRFRTFPPSLPN